MSSPSAKSPVEHAVAGRSTSNEAGVVHGRFLHALEKLSEGVTNYISSHWGTLTTFLFLILGSIVFLREASSSFGTFVEQVMTMLSLALLFLLQRSQTKATLSLQVKLNELLRAAHESDNHLINIERLSEDELKALHDRYQALHDERRESLRRGERDAVVHDHAVSYNPGPRPT